MADPPADGAAPPSRKEKRQALKKQKRRQKRQEAAVKERQEEEARANDPQEQLRIRAREEEEAELAERARREFEDRERIWLEAAARRKEEEEARRQELLEESRRREGQESEDGLEDDEWEYVDEEGPAEIIWGENEIIVKKKKVKVRKRSAGQCLREEEDDRPTSNPLPPQSAAFAAFQSGPPLSAQELLESVAQQTPNFGTEQDKAHCPFHLKTGACRFGVRCSRVHFYPDKANTLLIRNMYSGLGLAWELDEGLEVTDRYIASFLSCLNPLLGFYCCEFYEQSTDEEVERCYEEFYEDAHTEFLKFGEIINFKVCRNSSVHLRGNVYVHYKSIESAVLAFDTMNGRYFAGKQIKCEFVSVTRWKIAICGEYMKSRFKTCSRGATCNFIHCFRNPGGDYEWADWDNPPPRHWLKKMSALFGTSDNAENHKNNGFEGSDHHDNSSRKSAWTSKRLRSGHGERNHGDTDSEGRSNVREGRHGTRISKQGYTGRRRRRKQSDDDQEKPEGYTSKRSLLGRSGNVEIDTADSDSEPELINHEGRGSSRRSKQGYSSRRRKEKQSDDDWEKLEGSPSSKTEYGHLHATRSPRFKRSHSREKESSRFENTDFEDPVRVHKRYRSATNPHGKRSPEFSNRYSDRYDGRDFRDCDDDRYHTDEKSSRLVNDSCTRHSYGRGSTDRGTEQELLDKNTVSCENAPKYREVQQNPERYDPLCEEPDVGNNCLEHSYKSRGESVSSEESPGEPKSSNVTGCQDLHRESTRSRRSRYQKSKEGDVSPGDSFCSRKNRLHSSYKKTRHRSTSEEDDGSFSCRKRMEHGSAYESPDSEDTMALDSQKSKHTDRRRKHEKRAKKYSDDEEDHKASNSCDLHSREKEPRKSSQN